MELSINDLKLLPEIKIFLDWEWSINIRDDGRVELICPHGIGHTAWSQRGFLEHGCDAWSQRGFLEHGCDGCCDGDHFKDVVKKLKDLLSTWHTVNYIAPSTTSTTRIRYFYDTSTSSTY